MRLINLFFEDNEGQFWSYLQVLRWKKFPGVNRIEILLVDGAKVFVDREYADYFMGGLNTTISIETEERTY